MNAPFVSSTERVQAQPWISKAYALLEEHPLMDVDEREHGGLVADLAARIAIVISGGDEAVTKVASEILGTRRLSGWKRISLTAWLLMNNLAEAKVISSGDFGKLLVIEGLDSDEASPGTPNPSGVLIDQPYYAEKFWMAMAEYDAEAAKVMRELDIYDVAAVKAALDEGVDIELVKSVLV